MDISFIIPVHNGEKYIQKCIRSIEDDVSNSNLNCELIVVENGSTDDTAAIVQECCKMYDNIVFTYSDKGVSKARNKGINLSKGNKIIFVDSDDLWLRNGVKIIEKHVSVETPELIVCSYEKGNKDIIHQYEHINEVIHGTSLEDVKEWMISEPTKRMAVWAKVFSSKLIKNNNIMFDETISYSEDSDFVIKCLKKATSIMISNEIVYHYSIDTISTMRSINVNRANSFVHSLEKTSCLFFDESEQMKRAFYKYVLINLNVILVHDILSIEINKPFYEKVRETKKLLKHTLFSNALSKTKLLDLHSINLIPELFFKLRLYSLGCLICIVKSFMNKRSRE